MQRNPACRPGHGRGKKDEEAARRTGHDQGTHPASGHSRMENKMETTIVSGVYVGIMGNKMETTIVYGGVV